MKLTDRLAWRDRLLATLLVLALFGALLALVSCGGEMPEDEPYSHVEYWPFVASPYVAPASKQGVAIIGNNRAEWARPRPDDARRLGAAWWYNWAHVASFGGVAQDAGEFVPMIWGKGIPRDLRCPQGGAPLLWLNEPDLRSQANATPVEAVAMLSALVDRCPDARLIGPHISSERSAFTWLSSFWQLWSETGRPFPSTIGVHIYNHSRPSEWIDAIYGAVPGYTGAVWVTEFAYCGDGDRVAMFAAMVEAFERDSRVERYAPFANRIDADTQDFAWLSCGTLLDRRGRLTPIGAEMAARGEQQVEAYP
jgi:hypothetical protein